MCKEDGQRRRFQPLRQPMSERRSSEDRSGLETTILGLRFSVPKQHRNESAKRRRRAERMDRHVLLQTRKKRVHGSRRTSRRAGRRDVEPVVRAVPAYRRRVHPSVDDRVPQQRSGRLKRGPKAAARTGDVF